MQLILGANCSYEERWRRSNRGRTNRNRSFPPFSETSSPFDAGHCNRQRPLA